MSGKFITLEGGEGAGKSTQALRLAERLRGQGITVVTTREPGGSEGAEAVRALFVDGAPDRWSVAAEACLINAARADHVERLIRPALERGDWVICDRFVDSTLAYQGAGKGLADSALRSLHHIAAADLWPDLTVLLDLPFAEGLERARSRGGAGRFEAHDTGFHGRVRAGFLQIAADEPARCRIVDSTGDADAVEAAVWAAVELLCQSHAPHDDGYRAPPETPAGRGMHVDTGDD
ncbi:dTMP kinase [Glacieibacterium frigidum]|uniref:Thymidylate kinase n=1 Tax=Glacieibacterium frigidum TaxID=2593303 RepID=A0A552UIH7_9SPHN|nr:dTMP kinase [Glacieibacterium frigidum]TRW17990.1 dTMP kinase [Glacieibacterium frigidum]